MLQELLRRVLRIVPLRAICCASMAAMIVGGLVGPAEAQVVSSRYNGIDRQIKLEFWNASDPNFQMGTGTYRATGTWTAEQIASVERGIDYWWEVLRPQNTPGRVITLRMIRTGQELTSVGPPESWRAFDTSALSDRLAIQSTWTSYPNAVWAYGTSVPAEEVVDAFINFDSSEVDSFRLGPLQPHPGVNLEVTTIHEVAHTLGMTGANGTFGWNNVLGMYESQIVTIDNLGNRVPVPFGKTAAAGEAFFFNGMHARAVYGDVAYGEDGKPVPLNTLSPQKSHLGLDSFTMTHETFRNYPYFTEVELAVLMDLGFQIDLRKHFGRSIYTDGAGTAFPDLVNNVGYDSTATYGVGLHVKASERNILQQADLNAAGVAGNAIRIDGNNNHFTVAQGTTVSSNGDYGVGLLVSNGKHNDIVHRGTINATSTTEDAQGTGIMIGFGYDTMGPEDGANRNSATDTKYAGGYLVDELAITGTINAGDDAILIDHTAAVRDINLMAGASINGDITVNALIGTARDFARPTITFGYVANQAGLSTADADRQFSLNYGKKIGGGTLMDAKFIGGIDHATGTTFSSENRFNSVDVGREGRVTVTGEVWTTQAIQIAGVLNSVQGQVESMEKIVVKDGGRLSGTGAIAAPLVENQQGGTMFAGNSIGTMTIYGDFESNGNLQFDFTNQNLSQDASLFRIVGGTATINGGVPYTERGQFQFNGDDPNDPESHEIARRYTIVASDSPGQLQISQRPIAEDNVGERRMILRSNTDATGFYTPGAQNYYAYVGRDVPFATLGQSANQQAVGTYLDQLFTLNDGSELGNEVQWFRDSLDLIPDEGVVLGLLNQMSGELYASIGPMLVQQSYLMQNRLLGRLRNEESRLLWCDPDGNERTSGFGGWVTGFGTGGSASSDGNATGYGYSAGGSQVVVLCGLTCDTSIGGYYNYTGANFAGGSVGSANAQANEFGVLFTHHTDVAHVLFLAGGGSIDTDAQRGLFFGNTDVQAPVYESLRSNFDGTIANVYGEYGRRYQSGYTTYRPFAGLGYVLYSQSAAGEQGSELGTLSVGATSIASLRSLLGVDTSTLMGEGGNLRLDARAFWMHDFLNNGVATVVSTFTGTPGAGFAIQGVALGRDFAVVGTTISQNIINENMRLFAGYDLFANGQQALNSGNAGFEMLW